MINEQISSSAQLVESQESADVLSFPNFRTLRSFIHMYKRPCVRVTELWFNFIKGEEALLEFFVAIRFCGFCRNLRTIDQIGAKVSIVWKGFFAGIPKLSKSEPQTLLKKVDCSKSERSRTKSELEEAFSGPVDRDISILPNNIIVRHY